MKILKLAGMCKALKSKKNKNIFFLEKKTLWNCMVTVFFSPLHSPFTLFASTFQFSFLLFFGFECALSGALTVRLNIQNRWL